MSSFLQIGFSFVKDKINGGENSFLFQFYGIWILERFLPRFRILNWMFQWEKIPERKEI